MSHTLFIRNMSGHDQLFQVHGWNNNQDIVVQPHSEATISAPDGSSGAIIAIHDGQIGEQAEITKCGFGGNDFIDMSNICGAGGNMIVQQVGDDRTRKGDPRFMQNLSAAWQRADQGTKDALRDCVFERDGRVVRIAAPKDFPKLEEFVRTFADGKTYIGVGAWNGSAGNPNDNNQSSAAQGSKDILICYNDDDATPHDAPVSVMTSFAVLDPQNGEAQASAQAAPAQDATKPEDFKAKAEALLAAAGGDASAIPPEALQALAQSSGQADAAPAPTGSKVSALFTRLAVSDSSNPGIHLTNKSRQETEYFFYDNYWNGNGTAGANFDHPLTSVKLQPDGSQFVPLPASFKGRVQRGTQLPCTWVEFQLEAADDHRAHGDISLQQGCDGAATIASTDGTNVSNGFDHDVLSGAPDAAIRNKPNGERAIDTTVGNWNGGPNQAAIDYLNNVVGQSKAYILGGTGVPDVASANKQLAVVMY